MKRTLIPAALVLVVSGGLALAQQTQPVSPQQDPAPMRQHEHHARDPHKAAMMLSRKLNLTPDQTAKLEPILVDRDQKISALQSNSELARKDRHQQMHAIQKNTEQQLAGVLTPDQIQQMKSMRHGRHGRGDSEPQASTPPSA